MSEGARLVLDQDPAGIVADAAVLFNLIAPSSSEALYQALEASERRQEAADFQIQLHLPSGKVKWLLGQVVALRQEDGSTRWNGLLNDITKLKKRKQKLVLSEKLLRQGMRLAKLGAWELDALTGETTWSEEVYRMHELDPASAQLSLELALGFYPEAFQLQVRSAVELCLAAGSPFDLEVPFTTAKGRHLWARVIGQADKQAGRVVRIHGTFQDITDHKQVEEQLRVVFESSTNALILYDESGLMDCNAACLEMMGFDQKAQVLGKHPFSFSLPEPDGKSPEMVSKIVREAAITQGKHRFESRLRRANGEIFFAEVTINPVLINHKQAFLGVVQDLTERKQAEALIELTESRWMLTQELTMSGSLEKDLRTNTNTWSPQAFRIFGLPQVGNGPENEQIYPCIYPEDLPVHQAALKRAIEQQESSHYVLRIRTPQLESKFIEVITKPILDEQGQVIKIYGTILDITRQKQAEKALLQKQEQLKKFIEFSPVALAMFDNQLHYIAASKKWREIQGLQGQSVIGSSHLSGAGQLPAQWQQACERGLAGEISRFDEDILVNHLGQQEWVRWEVWPWYENEGESGGIILFMEQITEQKMARQELIEAKEQAEQAAIAKTQFLSTMSHEIRTPMNAVIGLTHLLLQNKPRPDQLENLNTLRFSAGNLLDLINDILDFNKIEAGKIDFEQIAFSLEDLVRNIRLALAPQAEDKGLALKLMLDEELPPVVLGDPMRLGQILTNLIGNAIKFTAQGKVSLTLHLEARDQETTTVLFQVKDTGIGIAAEHIDHIFERFTQATADTTRKFGGTGLGLAITKRLLELQGSQIQVDSVLGEGSTFYFSLGFKTSTSRLSGNKELLPLTVQSLQGTRVLMAEDYPINVLIVQQFLHKWDIEVDVAENGQVAVEMVQQQDYDLVLMDLQMPLLDGYQATAAIRLLGGKYAQLPIIALTASAMLDIQDKAFEVGMNDYLSKPFEPNELYKKIARHAAAYRISQVQAIG
ncbi:MAG: PAS domain S-box protein [Adhaeribacter sp.]